MISIDGQPLSGLEKAQITIFGDYEVKGVAEFASTNREFAQEKFHVNAPVIPIIGAESMVRTIGFASKSGPDMFDHIRTILPPGLITFGVNSATAAARKINGTHMDIILREWGMGNGPVVPFLGVVIEKVYEDQRFRVYQELYNKIGGKAIAMSRMLDGISIVTE